MGKRKTQPAVIKLLQSKYLFIMVVLYPVLVYCQTNDSPYKSIGFSYGRGITFSDASNAYSYELFCGPGIRKSTNNRFALQYSLFYNYSLSSKNIYNDNHTLALKINNDNHWLLFLLGLGEYFHISDVQGIYAYADAGVGFNFDKVNYRLDDHDNGIITIPIYFRPGIGVNYRYKYLFADAKAIAGSALFSIGFIY